MRGVPGGLGTEWEIPGGWALDIGQLARRRERGRRRGGSAGLGMAGPVRFPALVRGELFPKAELRLCPVVGGIPCDGVPLSGVGLGGRGGEVREMNVLGINGLTVVAVGVCRRYELL
ncbi:hypothetical protein GCM10009863_25300 [Streptomyces axinellae]|uniref:Uncharacterized protein n=1 Tax=Streptomyces axinellae TaxID=552788 RepID=A0ABP6CGA6_9ACTN